MKLGYVSKRGILNLTQEDVYKGDVGLITHHMRNKHTVTTYASWTDHTSHTTHMNEHVHFFARCVITFQLKLSI